MLLSLPAVCVKADWKSDADARIEQFRKGNFTVHLVDVAGKPISGAMTCRQTRSDFLFGCCVNGDPYKDDENTRNYERYILDHFNIVTCENAMKWWTLQPTNAAPDYAQADAWAKWAAEHHLPLRGHSLLWEKTKWVQPWLQDLNADDLRKAVDAHLAEVIERYRGKVCSWDVLNEQLSGDFYVSRLSADFPAALYKRAAQLDPAARLYTNEYSILTLPERVEKYATLIEQLKASGAPISGIGIQDHGLQRFHIPATTRPTSRPEAGAARGPEPDEIYASLERLARLQLPITLTEISVASADEELKADSIDMFYRVAFSHPRVEAIVLWGFWEKRHFKKIQGALVAADWTPLPAGKALDHLLLDEWRTRAEAKAGADGVAVFRGFFGEYDISVKLEDGKTVAGKVSLRPGAHDQRVVLR